MSDAKMNAPGSDVIPLSLYIHIPWCVQKCPYCDFNSHQTPASGFDEKRYIDALLQEIELSLPLIWGRSVISVFIGGGTPSLFSPLSIHQLLSGIRKLLGLAITREITMEANPGTVEQGRFHEFASAGINRLSLGIQSFNDIQLKALGRIHTADEAYNAIQIAQQAGFSNINLDLMFGLPEQSIKTSLADIQQAIDMETSHLSFYQLTIEPNTLFHKHPPVLPLPDDIWLMQEKAQKHLEDANFSQYEVSAFCQHGKQARHNTNYWEFGDYLGIGAGAHGKITDISKQQIIRTKNHKNPEQYMLDINNQSTASSNVIAAEDLPFEYMLNRLRLYNGFSATDYETRTGLQWESIAHIINQCIANGLMTHDVSGYNTSETGKRFLNDLICLFLPD